MLVPVYRSVLVILLRVGVLALLAAVPAWLLGGAVAGVMLAGTVVLLAFVYYAVKLARLSEWLNDPRAATLPDAGGMWGDVLGRLYRLIKQERAAQQALADTLGRFQQAADALPDGAMMLDRNKNIVWLNPIAEAHWGISLANDRLQTVTYFIRFPEFTRYLDERNYREPLTLRISRKDAGGASKDMLLVVQLVPFGDDQMLLLSRDESERDRLETMRRDFVANVSHELRTPITVLTGFLETIDNAGTGNPSLLEKSLAHMSVQAQRMQRLVEDLLALSRLEDNTNRPSQAPINVPALIADAIADAEQLSAGRHSIHSRLCDAWLVGNHDEIASAFGNLVSNAVSYTPDGTRIDITWDCEGGAPVFRVSDNGEGIAPVHIPRLTERFYRVDRSRSRASGGTGLGLAIVKHVLIRHGGRLEIKSTQDSERHGSAFTLLFPAERLCQPAPKLQAVAA